jgi:hypothetical protein
MGLLPGFAALFQQRISILEGTNENTDWPHFDAEKLFGYLELLERAGRFDSRHLGLHIPNSSPAETNAVLGFLRREIVHIYGTPVDSAVLSAKAPHRALLHVLDAFHPVGDPMAVFTTNYDLILESRSFRRKTSHRCRAGGRSACARGFQPSASVAGCRSSSMMSPRTERGSSRWSNCTGRLPGRWTATA